MEKLYIGWNDTECDSFIGTMEDINNSSCEIEDLELLEDFEIRDIIEFINKFYKFNLYKNPEVVYNKHWKEIRFYNQETYEKKSSEYLILRLEDQFLRLNDDIIEKLINELKKVNVTIE